MSGKIEAIYLRARSGEPPHSVSNAKAKTGLGLVGDHYSKPGGKRQITILAQEGWDAACQELGKKLHSSARRANVVVSGVDIQPRSGQYLNLGGVLVQVEGETMPCRLMDEASQGLWDALKPGWRGGVYGQVLCDGNIRIGDEVTWTTGL